MCDSLICILCTAPKMHGIRKFQKNQEIQSHMIQPMDKYDYFFIYKCGRKTETLFKIRVLKYNEYSLINNYQFSVFNEFSI